MADAPLPLTSERLTALLAGNAPQQEQSNTPNADQLQPQQQTPLSNNDQIIASQLQAQQGQGGPPKQGGKPLIVDYLQKMLGGESQRQGATPLQRPESRGDATLQFLGQFLSNMSAGLAQAGHGPGANLRGAAGAIQAPYQRDVAQYQMQQQQQAQQAQIQSEQAKAQLEQAQAEQAKNVVMTPYGPMNQKLAEKVFPAAIRKEGMENVADTKANADPIKQQMKEAFDLLGKGDTAGFKTKLAAIQQATLATKAPAKDNEISLIQKANAGDKDALATWNKLQSGRIAVRGAVATMRPMTYYDPEQQRNITLGGGEAERMQKEGRVLIPAGPVPASILVPMQRAQNAVPAALNEVGKYIDSWDNAGDRAIFARVIKDTPEGGDPASWFGNVLNQVAKENLSDHGQKAVVRLQRLNESLGTVRAISGLPATAGSMMATRALMPGATTPNSKMAKDQLDQIRSLVEQETGIPFVGGGSKIPPVNAPAATGNYSPGNPFAKAK